MVWWWSLALRICEEAEAWIEAAFLIRWKRVVDVELTLWSRFYSPATDAELEEIVRESARKNQPRRRL